MGSMRLVCLLFAATTWTASLPAYEKFVEEWMRENNIPGITIGFFKGDVTWVKSFGFADLENRTPMRPDSSFRLASVQKSMTAVAVLQLAEQGKLDLDADIQKYVPYFPQKPYRITPRQLLAHLGGIPHYMNRDVEQHIKVHKSVRETIDIFANADLVAEPGTKFNYSTYGYDLLGAAIENVTGMPYGEYMAKHVWGPAGMLDTRMDDPTALIPNRVRGYKRDGDALVNSEFIDISTRFAGGGTRGTVPDLLRFLRAVDRHALLSEKSTKLMFTPARTKAGEEVPYALGWAMLPIENRGEIVANDGGQQETRTFMLLDPASDFGLALAMNLEADIYGPPLFRLVELVEGRALSPPKSSGGEKSGGLRARPSTLTLTPHVFEAADGTKIDAEKGEFRVPENRSKPGSRTIALRFVRFKSTASKPGHPIVYLAGGPGGSGIGSAYGSRFPLFMALREFGDVIAYDQRGTNESEPDMRCKERYAIDPGEPLDRAKGGAAIAEATRKCVARLRAEGIDAGAYNTIESAADLEDLRLALGAQKLILWGISYGTHLSLATLRYQPDTVDRVILAGIEASDDTYKLPSDQQTLMEDIARLAAKDGKHPDLLGSIAKLLRELDAHPKAVTIKHPETGEPTRFVLGKLDLQTVLAGMLFAPENFAGMPDLITRLEQGDWTALALLAAPNRFGDPFSAMSKAMDCASGMTEARRRRIAAEAKLTLLGDAINAPFPEVCEGLGIPDLGDEFRAPLRSNTPALLISGTLDGRTRPRQAEELRLGMPNAQSLIIEGAGHSDPLFLSSPKILEAMKAFLRGEPLRERYLQAPPVQFK